MRISGDAEDLYAHHVYQRIIASGCVPWVYLDGKRIPNVVIADEEEGYILASIRDDDGKMITGADGKILDREYRGEVKIVVMAKEYLEHGVH